MGNYAESTEVLHAIKTLEAIKNRNPREQAALDKLKALIPAAQGEIDATNATWRGAAQGVTLSARDELAGVKDWLTGGMTADAYTQGRDASRGKDYAAASAFPSEFNKGKTAGNVMTMAVPAGGTMKVTQGMGLLGKMLIGGGVGAATGGFDGFMSGEGFGNRVDRAKLPAAIGGGIGFMAPALGTMAGGLTRGIQNAKRHIPGYGALASNKVARSFNSRRLAEAGDIPEFLNKLGPDGMPLDIPGAPRKLAQGVAAMPGKGGDVLQDAIEARASGASGRITQDADEVLGAADAAFDARRAQAAERVSKWGPDYDAALAHKDPINIEDLSDTLAKAQFDEASSVSGAVKKVERDLGIKIKTEGGKTVVTVPEVSATRLHNVRSSLSDAADAARAANKPALARKLTNVLEEIDAKLDSTVVGYKATRTGYANNKAIEESIDEGRKAFSGSTETAIPLRELKEKWKTMSDAQKDAYRKGAREWIDSLMGTSRNDAAAAWGAFDKGWNDEKMRFLFGDAEGGRLLNRLNAEQTFSKSRGDVLMGSQTQARAEATEALADLRDVDTGRRPGPLARAKRQVDDAGNAVVDALVYGPRRANANEEIGKILSLQGVERDEAMRGLLAEALSLKTKTKAQKNVGGLLDFMLRTGGTGLVTSSATAPIVPN